MCFLGSGDLETLRYISDALGHRTIVRRPAFLVQMLTLPIRCLCYRSRLLSQWFHPSAPPPTIDRAVLDPLQVREFTATRGNMIVLRSGGYLPLKLKAAPYFTELPVWKYAASPHFGDRPMRAITRRLLVSLPEVARALLAVPGRLLATVRGVLTRLAPLRLMRRPRLMEEASQANQEEKDTAAADDGDNEVTEVPERPSSDAVIP